jgi:NAD(P)-dependent dehydrogenase (short-subunit alcohol dehydrogenase family)
MAMTRAMAVELARHQIRANTIVSGWIDTPMTDVALHGEAFMGRVLPRVPMRRWGVGDDFGGVAVYLASDASKYHTGHTFVIDGGSDLLTELDVSDAPNIALNGRSS